MKKLRYGATVPCWNREQYIGPYLEQLLELDILPVVTLGNQPWAGGGNQESVIPDRTEKILEKFFPNVFLRKEFYAHHRDSFNRGIDKIKQDVDVIFVHDCDIFMTKAGWQRQFRFIEDNFENYLAFSYNHINMVIEYYYDWRYGKPAMEGGVPPMMAINSTEKMENMIESSTHLQVNWSQQLPFEEKIHHLRFTKANGSGKHLYNEPTSNLHDYKQAPEEILNRILKWQEILKTL